MKRGRKGKEEEGEDWHRINPHMVIDRAPEMNIESALRERYGTESEEMLAIIEPHLTDEALRMAGAILGQLLSALHGTVAGEALRHALGLQLSSSSLRETARLLGTSVQNLSQLSKRISDKLPEPLRQERRGGANYPPTDEPGVWLNRVEACGVLSLSTASLERMEKLGLLDPVLGRNSEGVVSLQHFYRRAQVEDLRERCLLAGGLGRRWAERLAAEPRVLPVGSKGGDATLVARPSEPKKENAKQLNS